jgi:hypothetical protein
MLAHLLLIAVVMTANGPVQVLVKFPMPSMQTCEAYMLDPAPILVGNAVGGETKCVNEPTDKGKPV